MNILQILPELVVGGVETGTVDLTAALIEKGHKVVVISNGGPLVERLGKLGAKHYKLAVHKKSIFSVLKCAKELCHIIQDEKIQVIHARSRVPAIIAAISLRRIVSKNLDDHLPVFITTCHGYYSKHIFSRPMGWGRFIIVSSNIIAMHMIEDFGVPFERIKFIPRGVDLSKFKFIPPSQRKNQNHTIVVIGRLTPIKGHEFFIKAVSKVVKIMPAVKVFIVGKPPQGKEEYQKQLELLTEKLGISESVEFLGHRQDIPQILSKADLLVLPSIGHEAFGRVVIEAAASGVPVIATKVGGLADVITDRKTGILVTPLNILQLADAMIEVVKNDKLAEELANNARDDIQKRFTLEIMSQRTLDVYQEALDKIKILVIKIGAVGDVVLASPSLRAIRERFPKAHITVLTGVESRQILQNCPYVDELIIYNKGFIKKNLFNFIKLARNIRRAGFDIVIDFQNSSKSHILSFFSMAPKRFGYKNKKLGFLLNYGIKDVKVGLPPVQHQFRVLDLLKIPLKNENLEIWPSEDDFKFVDEFLSGQWLMPEQPLVGINIGGSLKWRTKRWPKDKLFEICDELAKKNIRVVFTGTKDYQNLARDIIAKINSKPINAVGKTSVNQLAALIKRLNAFISTDSAPMHIAAAVSVPVVAVFGPTDPRRHIPPAKNIIVIEKRLRCSPCYKSNCRKFKCMKEIDVQEIMNAVNNFLPKTEKK